MFTLGITRRHSNSSTVLQPDEAQIVRPLAEFSSVTVQTLASLEGFIRDSAQQLAAGSMPDSQVSLAVDAINAVLFRIPLTEPGPLLSLAIAAGPGSPQQQQLYSLLSSLLKLSALGANSSDPVLAESLSFSCLITACAAIKLLELAEVSERVNSTSSSGAATQQSQTVTGAPEAAAPQHHH